MTAALATPDREPVTPAVLHRLANTAEVAGFGPEVDAEWLRHVARQLVERGTELFGIAARADLGLDRVGGER